MPLLSTKSHSVYLTKILSATSQEEVKHYLDAAIEIIITQNPGVNKIDNFIKELMDELVLLSPMNKDAGQWSNINMARIYLHQIVNTTSSHLPVTG